MASLHCQLPERILLFHFLRFLEAKLELYLVILKFKVYVVVQFLEPVQIFRTRTKYFELVPNIMNQYKICEPEQNILNWYQMFQPGSICFNLG